MSGNATYQELSWISPAAGDARAYYQASDWTVSLAESLVQYFGR
jgi:hypothetical protein